MENKKIVSIVCQYINHFSIFFHVPKSIKTPMPLKESLTFNFFFSFSSFTVLSLEILLINSGFNISGKFLFIRGGFHHIRGKIVKDKKLKLTVIIVERHESFDHF